MKDAAGTRTSERANRREATGPKGEGRDSPSTFPQYPEYKDSGVEWLGEVPAHWVVGPLRWYATIQGGVAKGKSYSDDTLTVDLPYLRVANVQDGHVDLSSVNTVTVALSEVDRYRLQPGDVLMNEGGDNDKLGRGTVWQGEIADCLHQNHVFAIRPNQYLLPYWLSMFTRSSAARSYFYLYSKQSTNLASISSSNVMSCPLPLPPTAEQREILSFLDNETARIDALVEEQQRLIELLKEKRQAVISHAVTKGLDPDVPMKDSGVEWLGEVPAHWRITRVKHIVHTVEQGWSPQCENSPVESESEWGVLKVGCVNHGRFVSQENKKLPDNLSPRLDLCIKADDVLISRANTRELVGSCAVPAVSYPNLMLSDKLFRLRVRETVADPRFLAFFMGAPQTRQQIELEATGASSSMLNIGQSTVLEMPFPCSPLEEQAKIRDEIIKQTWSLLDLAGQALELQKRLEERRSALISAAVTGKIDVRGWQVGQHAEQAEVLLAAEERAAYVYGKEPSDEV
jgi:type I restriction enzyme S subunit